MVRVDHKKTKYIVARKRYRKWSTQKFNSNNRW